MTPSASLRTALLLLAVVQTPRVLSAGEGAPARATPLNASVMIFNEWGLRDAPAHVERAAAQGHRRLNVVVTIHAQIDNDLQVLNYGLIRAREGWQYTPFDEPLLAQFRRQLGATFARAVELGLDVAVLPHVDAAGPEFGWRNRFDLDPRKPCGGYSYRQAMIDPIVDALGAAIGPTTRVELALTGEMGRTVFAYPEAYRSILAELRRHPRLGRSKIGVSINFNEVSGRHEPTAAGRATLRKLIEESDFLGISCYGSVGVPPQARDFAAVVDTFAAELKGHGVTIPERLALHFSEVGLGGGGRSGMPADIARAPAEAASSAWAGTSDPAQNPWATEPMRAFRRD
ncbi:MAG TPA: hypothetical protein VF590_07295, partial [Isosphaeraceae bacterium]